VNLESACESALRNRVHFNAPKISSRVLKAKRFYNSTRKSTVPANFPLLLHNLTTSRAQLLEFKQGRMAGTLEDQLLQLLADTMLQAEAPRKQAEQHLEHLQSNPAFPGSLGAVAIHSNVSPEIRQAALLLLAKFVDKNWSGQNEDGVVVPISDQTKEQLRVQMLELATSSDADRKIKSSARCVSHGCRAWTLANGRLLVTL
jgi:Importin-beta N-terminal domain